MTVVMKNPAVITKYFAIHREALLFKTLHATLELTLATVIRIVNHTKDKTVSSDAQIHEFFPSRLPLLHILAL